MALKIPTMQRRAKLGGNAGASVLLAAAVLFGLGAVLSNVRARVDLTENDAFTLAPASRDIAARLEDPATATLYFTEDLPAYLLPVKRRLLDLLGEYRSASGGSLAVREIDPAKLEAVKEPSDAEKADLDAFRAAQIPKVQFNVIEKDAVSVKNGYFGLVLTYRDAREAMPVVQQNLDTFEYDFSSLLKKLTSTAPPKKVVFTSGHEEVPPEELIAFRGVFAKDVEVAESDLAAGVPEGTGLVVVAGPKTAFTPEQGVALTAHLEGGGTVLLLHESANVANDLQAAPSDDGLAALLGMYGIVPSDGLAGDLRSNEMLPFSSGQMQFLQQYPYFIRARAEGMAKDSPVTNGLSALSLLWPTSFSLRDTPGVTTTALVQSTDEGFVAQPPWNLAPTAGSSSASATGRQILAVSAVGKGRIIAVGDADFARDGLIRGYQHNLVFLGNAVDWLLQDEELIAIRTKAAPVRDLDISTPEQRSGWKAMNLAVPPLLVLLLGAFVWQRQRRA